MAQPYKLILGPKTIHRDSVIILAPAAFGRAVIFGPSLVSILMVAYHLHDARRLDQQGEKCLIEAGKAFHA
jgi:hypothetical protein